MREIGHFGISKVYTKHGKPSLINLPPTNHFICTLIHQTFLESLTLLLLACQSCIINIHLVDLDEKKLSIYFILFSMLNQKI